MKEGKTMRMETKLPIVTVVGAAALLLAVLAVVIAPRSQTAYAQSQNNIPPTVSIVFSSYLITSTTEGRMEPGGQLFARITINNLQSEDLTCLKNEDNKGNHSTAFTDPCYRRAVIYRRGSPSSTVSACERGIGGRRSFSRGDGNLREFGYSQNQISPDCPVGEYTLKVYLLGSNHIDDAIAADNDPYEATSLWYGEKDFKVVAPPQPQGGNQGSGNQGSGNQGSGNQGSGNQGSGNQGSGNQGGGNQGRRRQPGRRQPGWRQPGWRQPDRDPNGDGHHNAYSNAYSNAYRWQHDTVRPDRDANRDTDSNE